MAGRINWFLVAGACIAAGAAVAAQQRTTPTPSIRIDSLAGRDSFDLYCASCHGTSGRGDGPVAPALRTRPADLTMLAQRHDGAFPRDQVRASLTAIGRSPAAHGTAEMPVWGPLLRAFESDARVRERIENLLTHVESLQQASTRVDDPGAEAFRTYCASCHGTSGRGNGPIADQLRTRPPDLTRFTTRNGGVFPLERVMRLVDGGGVSAHGSLEMPVWGDAFRVGRGRLSADEAKARIEAIVRFLQRIQERPA